MLEDLKIKEKKFEEMINEGMVKQYDKILTIYNEEKDKEKLKDKKGKQQQLLYKTSRYTNS